MWLSRHVDVPDRLLEAGRSGRLVVFAGAGVSIPPPSGLPNLERLANEIAQSALKNSWNKELEPLDRFLGRLDRHNIPVHQRAAKILSDPASRPTSMHRDICRLFRTPQDLRIVTTNCDTHFTTAAHETVRSLDIYRAPALPRGRAFSGLIYLHGCVDRAPDDLVLTDQDFGRAYLTEAWATAFLISMFRHYTVLFVGYSLEDTVIHYLTRALAPGDDRFILTNEPSDRWEYLGIRPVVYPKSDGSDSHTHLYVALESWASLVGMRHLDHEKRIADILSSPPPSEPDLASYIADALRSEERASVFVRHAKGVEWLRWAEAQEPFKDLFNPLASVGEVGIMLASWFVEEYVLIHPDEAMQVVQRQSQQCHPVLLNCMLQRLSRPPQPVSNVRSRWLAVVLSGTIPSSCLDWLNYLLIECAWPEDADAALLLFDALTTPRIALEPSFREVIPGSSTVNSKPKVSGRPYYVRQAWEKLFKPALPHCAADIMLIATRNLRLTHRLLTQMGGASDRWDYFSWRRTAVEPHEQDSDSDDTLCTLVDAARDTLEHMLQIDEMQGELFIELWNRSRTPVLRRLAVHGVGALKRWGPDVKLRWLVDNGYVYGSEAKHEVFHLLESCYPKATEPGRLYFLQRVDRGMDAAIWGSLSQDTRDYEKFNLLVWLSHVAPSCVATRTRLDAIRAERPDFEPRDHPDLEVYTETGLVEPSSRVSVDDLLSRSPERDFDWFETYEDPSRFGSSREGFLDNVSKAASQSFEWGEQLCLALTSRDKWTSDLWQGLLGGWTRGERNDRQWRTLLSHLHAIREPWHLIDSLVRLLEDSLTRAESPLPQDLIDDAVRLGLAYWTTCSSKCTADGAGPWLNRAINHWAGRFAVFMIRALSFEWKRDLVQWKGMEAPLLDAFQLMVTEPSYSGQVSRVVLASQVHFLFAADRFWTEQHVIPLFDWKDEQTAEQAWHGFLVWGRWANEPLLQQLLPYYKQSVTRLTAGLADHRENFCRHLAYIAARPNVDSLRESLLVTFLAGVGVEDRVGWAIEFRGALRSMPDEQKAALWSTWLMRYWDQRLAGIPRPLDTDELGEMVGWGVHLEPVLDEVVDRIESRQPVDIHDSVFLFMDFARSDLAERRPRAASRLLAWLLRGATRPFRSCHEAELIVRRLVKAGAVSDTMVGICENLARLSCHQASTLRTLVGE